MADAETKNGQFCVARNQVYLIGLYLRYQSACPVQYQ